MNLDKAIKTIEAKVALKRTELDGVINDFGDDGIEDLVNYILGLKYSLNVLYSLKGLHYEND